MRLIEPNQITKMMSDLYISKDAVNMTGERQGLWVRFRTIEKAVSEIPTIVAVEVVRCRDCKNWHSNTEFCDVWSHTNIAQRTLADDYCSYGVREDGEE